MMRIHNFLLVLLVAISTNSFARKIYIGNSSDVNKVANALKPGDSLFFKPGTYTDIKLSLHQKGSPTSPIVLVSETPGTVIFSGDAKIEMYGAYTELNGIYFTNGNRNPSQWKSHGPGLIAIYSSYCRVTNCLFNNFDEANSAYITTSLDEKGNVPTHCRIDHCGFVNKLTFDQVINLNNRKSPDKENKEIAPPMYHRIDHCFFSNPKKKGNAGGAIRIGYYRNSLGRCLVESNLFIRQDSESEIITSKSMENVFYANTIINCQGTLNFRHGDKQVAINNFFLSNDEKYNGYGGMFIWGSKHIIAGNYFSLSKTLESRGNAAIYLNPGAEGTEHALAFNSIIANNMFVNNNGYSIHFNPLEDQRKKLSKENNLAYDVPHHITIIGNTFSNSGQNSYPFFKDDHMDFDRKNQWINNTYWGAQIGLPTLSGLKESQPDFINRNGLNFIKTSTNQNSLSNLSGYYNSIEGIALRFDEVINSPNQKPLSIEEIVPNWMIGNLGNYYITGKLKPELKERLQRIAAGRED